MKKLFLILMPLFFISNVNAQSRIDNRLPHCTVTVDAYLYYCNGGVPTLAPSPSWTVTVPPITSMPHPAIAIPAPPSPYNDIVYVVTVFNTESFCTAYTDSVVGSNNSCFFDTRPMGDDCQCYGSGGTPIFTFDIGTKFILYSPGMTGPAVYIIP